MSEKKKWRISFEIMATKEKAVDIYNQVILPLYHTHDKDGHYIDVISTQKTEVCLKE